MSAWTPGPWKVTEPNGKGNGLRIDGPKDWPRLPEAWLGYEVNNKEQIANAHLIAAAPDLYEALRLAVINWLPQDSIYAPEARAALAKARGES